MLFLDVGKCQDCRYGRLVLGGYPRYVCNKRKKPEDERWGHRIQCPYWKAPVLAYCEEHHEWYVKNKGCPWHEKDEEVRE